MKQIEFLYAPKEPAAASPTPTESTSTPTSAETPQTTPAVASASDSTATTPTSQPSAVSGSGTTPSAASASGSAPTASWLDSFRSEGFQAADEATARTQLIQSYRDAERLRPLAPALSAYQQHQEEFHSWLSDRQKQKAQPSQEDWTAKLGWSPPAGDYQELRRQVTVNDKGEIIGVQGAPPDAVVKFQAAQAYRTAQLEKFIDNPFKFMEGAIDFRARQIAEQYSNQGVGQYREQQEAQVFVEKHRGWLFEQTQDGQVKTNQTLDPATGRYTNERQLSKWGQMFVQSLSEAASKGLSPEMQQTYALQNVQNAYLTTPEYIKWAHAQLAQQTGQVAPVVEPANARTQANDSFTKRANPAAAPTAASGGNAVPSPRKVDRNNLEQVMLERFREAGVTV